MIFEVQRSSRSEARKEEIRKKELEVLLLYSSILIYKHTLNFIGLFHSFIIDVGCLRLFLITLKCYSSLVSARLKSGILPKGLWVRF